MQAKPSEYEVPFFKETGFSRRVGEKCREYYWTLNPDFVEPQDVPCVDYWFDSVKSRSGLNVSEARRVFIDFFLKRGHEYVPPRPVVARWREDLYLTIASIVVFQPHVTNGIVPPPANPLVISQPSIRLEDIDNVGLTIGRHLTSFEMAAHHAFNYPDKYIYWKDETVRYAYEFFTKELGIPGELIVFKEAWWEGGGNAGPCFEVAVGGLELATLVFMSYKTLNGGYEEIPLRIVDTGYGVERIAWFSQKTPTAFHAIYGDLVDKFRDSIGLEKPERTLLWAAFKAAGKLDPDEPGSVEDYYRRVSELSGVSFEDARRILVDEARLYGLLDHTKTLALMLADGIVPSNSGEGYLARLVARRALRLLTLLKSNAKLVDLVDMQVKYWSGDFPQISENRGYVLEAVDIEESRFKETMERARRALERELKRGSSLTVNDLVKYYDSMGAPPELVAEIASKAGVRVEVPPKFYSIVASMHRSPPRIKGYGEAEGTITFVAEWASKFKPTRKLYYEDPYIRSFESRILGVNGRYVILEATAFYPTGGGQIHDVGVLIVGGREYRVVDVFNVDDVIIHVLETPLISEPGEVVRGLIDWARRFRIMRHHTATHVILGAARRVLGPHVWQAGAEKTEFKGRLDITHHKPLTMEEVAKIEALANSIVDDRRPVRNMLIDRNEAETKYGLTLFQGGVPMSRVIRVLDIEGWDTEACGGTHVTNTGEIGGIKIVNVERIQDGVVRIEYVAGSRAAEVASELEGRLARIADLIGASRGREEDRVKSLMESFKALGDTVKAYRELLIESLEEKLRGAPEVGGVKLLVTGSPEKSREAVQEMLRKLTSSEERAIVAVIMREAEGSTVEIAGGAKASELHNIGALARLLAGRFEGKGGGSKSYGSFKTPRKLEPGELAEALEELLGSGP